MIVDIQQNQQLQQQIAKLANNLGQLHHRQINKGNKQANNEKKNYKQTTIAKNTHWHLHRGPTAFSALDTPTADQLEISRFLYFLVLIVWIICSSKKPMVHSPESMLQCNERRKVKLIWNTIAVKCLWILHWLIWFCLNVGRRKTHLVLTSF